MSAGKACLCRESSAGATLLPLIMIQQCARLTPWPILGSIEAYIECVDRAGLMIISLRVHVLFLPNPFSTLPTSALVSPHLLRSTLLPIAWLAC